VKASCGHRSHGNGSGWTRPWLPWRLVTVVSLVVLWPSHQARPVPLQFTTYGEGRTVFEQGRVVSVTQRACTGAPGQATGPAGVPVTGTSQLCDTSSVALGTGPDVGRTVQVDGSGVSLQVGDRIRVARGPVTNPAAGARVYELDDYVRDTPLGVIAALFAALLFLVARWRGLAALAGVSVAYLVLVEFMLPALLDCRSPVAVAVTGSAAILFVVLYLAHGISTRTSTALLGTPAALGITGLLAAAATRAAHLTGRANEVNNELQAAGVHVSITGLILCGLIVGALGVLNDVTVTQASAVWELSAADPQAGWRELFTSGMPIGRDHIASTVYTLVFAYTGVALPLLLLFSVSGRSAHDLITGDEIAGDHPRPRRRRRPRAPRPSPLAAAVIAGRPHQQREVEQ